MTDFANWKPRMADPNLTAALTETLEFFENQDSPLAEATPDSIDILLDRINSAWAEGMPGKVDDKTLMDLVTQYRAQALRWSQEESIKKTKARATGSRTKLLTPAEAIDIDL